MRRFLPYLCVAVAGCGGDLSAPDAIVGTYSQYTVDGAIIPFVASSDSQCQYINTGGWISLAADGSYTLLVDQVRSLCGGVWSGGSAWGQRGKYVRTSDTTITMRPADVSPLQGFEVVFDPGNYTPGAGGTTRNLKFTVAGRVYWFLDNVP